ncbi:hypothetical protein OE855_002581 [Salmonella enterica subsp. enterica serovar Schwarzengrund]|nr:hypothetical protein [Salmonella enterica subsp. enterica serovar Schwarzengrund]
MKRFPTILTCLTVNKACPWFTVGKNYTPIYKDNGVFIQDDELDNGFKWQLTKFKNNSTWVLEIQNHVPRIVATFNEQDID